MDSEHLHEVIAFAEKRFGRCEWRGMRRVGNVEQQVFRLSDIEGSGWGLVYPNTLEPGSYFWETFEPSTEELKAWENGVA